MELVFIGTSSATPTSRRNVTALAIRDGPTWDLFDCGEGTQHRIQETSLTLPRLRRIYISHLHGDHCFGLPGVLTSRSTSGTQTPLELYGPEGLETMVRTVLDISESHLTFPLVFPAVPATGGRVVEGPAGTVDAIPLVHRVASYAWWIHESDRPGTFDVEAALALGVPEGPMFSTLQAGESVTLGDGRIVDPAAVMGSPRPGRSLVVAGDNSDPARLVARTGPVQLLVHEATFTEEVLARLPDDRGHSTAARVAAAAESVGIDHLVLTHFSARFDDADGVQDVGAEARRHYSGGLVLAEDFARYELTADGDLIALTPSG
jgi:ribonuclease Z